MRSTHLSLLGEATAGAGGAWLELVRLYRPFVYNWLRHHGLPHHDAEELTQDVLATIVQKLDSFQHNGRTGAFRRWLRQITVNRARAHWRDGRLRPAGNGRSSIARMVEGLEDPHSRLSGEWNARHDQFVLQKVLREVEPEVEETTMLAFRKLVFEEIPPDQVAADLGLSVGAVYSAKARVLRKLRKSAAQYLDETDFS